MITSSRYSHDPGAEFHEGQLTATDTRVDYWYIGKEAGYVNQFISVSLKKDNTGGLTGDAPGITQANISLGNSFGWTYHAGGFVDFQFKSNLVSGTSTTLIWDNKQSPPQQNSTNSAAIFGFLKSLTDWTFVSYATNVVVFGLDDSGANADDNHDDWKPPETSWISPV